MKYMGYYIYLVTANFKIQILETISFFIMKVIVLVAQSCLILCDPMNHNASGSSKPWDSPGKKTGMDWCSLLQRIFLTQGFNPGLLYCRQILYHLSYRKDHESYNYSFKMFGEEYINKNIKLSILIISIAITI